MNDETNRTKVDQIASNISMLVQNQLDVPKSTSGAYDLPCGYIDETGKLYTDVVVREIKGDVEDMLGGDLPANKKMNELLARCVERVGPYVDRGKISQIVLDLTVGDRVFLMFAIRRQSLGNHYPFKDKCPKCESERMFHIDLSELEASPARDPAKRSFPVELPSGRSAVIHPMTGRDEDRLVKETKNAKGTDKNKTTFSLGIFMRVDLIDGKPPTLADIQGLGLSDRNLLREEFQEIEGGLDTEVDLQCPDCEHDFAREVDVTQAGFFFPSATRKSSKTKRSI